MELPADMNKRCAWCGPLLLGPVNAPRTTSGICAACLAVELAAIPSKND